MEAFLDFLLRKIVDKPENLSIDKSEDAVFICFTITIDSLDFGKVIGKKGRNINSIKNLLYLYKSKTAADGNSKRISLKIKENLFQESENYDR